MLFDSGKPNYWLPLTQLAQSCLLLSIVLLNMSTNLSFKTCLIFTFSRNISYLPHPNCNTHIVPAFCQNNLHIYLAVGICLFEDNAIIIAPVMDRAFWYQEYSSLYGITYPCSVLEVTEKGKPTSVIHICSIPHFHVSPFVKWNKKNHILNWSP